MPDRLYLEYFMPWVYEEHVTSYGFMKKEEICCLKIVALKIDKDDQKKLGHLRVNRFMPLFRHWVPV